MPTAGLARSVGAARALGVQVDHVVVPGADHAFDTVDGSPDQRAGHDLLSTWARRQVALPAIERGQRSVGERSAHDPHTTP